MRIYYLNGEKAGQSFSLTEKTVTIGRETDNIIQLLVGGVSRYHAKIEFNGTDWILQDLGSTNGTKLNEKSIFSPVPLHDNDRILLGDQIFRVEADESVPRPGAPDSPHEEATNTLRFVFRPEENIPPPVQPPNPDTTPQDTAPAASDPDGRKASGSVIPEGDIFHKNTPEPIPENIFSKGRELCKGKSSLRGNLIFLLVLILILLTAGLLIYGMMARDRKKELAPPPVLAGEEQKMPLNPFFFFFERQKITPGGNNIFKFKVHGELRTVPGKKAADGTAKKRFLISVALDDLENGRHFIKTFGMNNPIPPGKIEQFRKDIVDAGFLNITQNNITLPGGNPNYDRMVAGFGDKLKEVIFYDGAGDISNDFTAIFQKLEFFLSDVCRLPSVMKTRKEILEEAEREFTAGQNFYDNYEDNSPNLQKAIHSYELAENLYSQFRNPPGERIEIAATRLAKLRKALAEKYTGGKQIVTRLQQTGEYEKAIAECAKRMRYFTPGSREYEEFRTVKINLEKRLRLRMKGR